MEDRLQLKDLHELLLKLSEQPLPEGVTLREFERNLTRQWRDLVPDKPLGRRLYESYTNSELIEILRGAYERLGRTPVQKDMFCFYRTYIKHRFVTWSEALRAAGLGYSLERGDIPLSNEVCNGIYKDEREIYKLLICLSEQRTELGHPPKRKEFAGSTVLKERFGCWGTALHAAEVLDQWLAEEKPASVTALEEITTLEEEALLENIKETAERLGRTPVKKEVREETRSRLRIRFGSWESVLYAAGLIPLQGEALKCAEWDYLQRKAAGSEALHRIAKLEPEYTLMLEELEALSHLLGRTPLKEEFDSEKRGRLQARCGSWRNVLYQIGLAVFSKEEAAEIRRKKRKTHRYRLQK